MANERRQWQQGEAEGVVADAQAERGFALHPAWRDTLLALMMVNGADTPAINRILDTLEAFEREAGRLPPRAALKLD